MSFNYPKVPCCNDHYVVRRKKQTAATDTDAGSFPIVKSPNSPKSPKSTNSLKSLNSLNSLKSPKSPNSPKDSSAGTSNLRNGPKKIIKFNTPAAILIRLIESEHAVDVADLDVLIASSINAIRLKIQNCDALIYVPDTRIPNCRQGADGIDYTLAILKDVLDKIRLRVAEYISANFDCNVIVTNQPVDNIAVDCDERLKWLSIKRGENTDESIKIREFPSAELVRDPIPDEFKQHPFILYEQRSNVGENGTMLRRRLLPNITTADEEMHLPLLLKIKILIEALSGAIFIRDLGYVHCDIKPHNIFILRDVETEDLIGMIGDLEGLVKNNPDNCLKPPTFTAQFCEEFYQPKSNNECKSKKFPLDEARDSFSWAITIAYFLNSRLTEGRVKKDLNLFMINIDDWFAYVLNRCRANRDLLYLLELCKKGVLDDRSMRPTLEEYKEALNSFYLSL